MADVVGTLPDGRSVERYTLTNARGMRVAVLTYGGILQRVEVPDAHGEIANVTLGFDDLAGYLSPAYLANTPFFGAIIGRYGNRIARGRFTLDGETYELPLNHPPNSLHGGFTGFHTRLWAAEEIAGGVRLTRTAADGENGYPGRLDVAVGYRLDDENRLTISYAASTDKPTVVNLTNHAYWNLAGRGTIAGHVLQINAARYTPVDDTLIPTGELAPVAGTEMDFRRPRAIGADTVYDHNWVLDDRVAAILHDPSSGRTLTIETTEPGLQFFSGHTLTPPRAGLALETQHFPDAPNQPAFPSTVLRPGERYTSETVLTFTPRAR
jgi:aldose 1-epimerase